MAKKRLNRFLESGAVRMANASLLSLRLKKQTRLWVTLRILKTLKLLT